MTLAVRLTVVGFLAYALPKAIGTLHGATKDDLDRRFSEYEILHPTLISAGGHYISHDLQNVEVLSNKHYIKRRKKRSLDDVERMDVSLSPENIVRRRNNIIDVRNDMYYDNDNETSNETDITTPTTRYAAFRRRAKTTSLPTTRRYIHFNVSAFGSKLRLRVQAKRRIIAPGAKSVFFESNGKRTEKDLSAGCLYFGMIPNLPRSKVAISNCDGLAGFIQTDDDEFFIEPIEELKDAAVPRKHVIYRRSAQLQSENIGKRLSSEIHHDAEASNDDNDSLGNSVADILRKNQGASFRKRKRHAKRNDYNIETLLTADSEVVRFHGRDHVENYLLTLINIVDEIYHDSSLDEHVNIVLSRLYQLDEAQSNALIIEDNASTSLKNVCKWAHRMQQTDPGPHGRVPDHSIFLTRRKFGPAGYAHVSGMCHSLRSCSLNHEDGFSSAFVVAHETGHVLGMEHDGEGNKCGDVTSMGSIMAPLVQAAFHRYHWSRCSQQELKRNLPNFSCLLDDPHAPDWGPTPVYPGVTYSMDDQCRFDFGEGYKRCTAFRNLDECRTLWCSHDDNPLFCKTKKGPPVDGTSCGDNMWCFKSHCVWRDQRQRAVDGNWGDWSAFSECSRSCGTGVMYRSRLCDNPTPSHGGNDCVGQNVAYDLCNTRPCSNRRDFRADQCMYRNNDVEYKNQRHKWLPYEPHDLDLKCDLFCVSKKTNDVVTMGDIVADGTLCSYDDPHGICIRGECVEVGCDKVIGSTRREDDCGVCGGDGSECRNLSGALNKRTKRKLNAYMKIYKIPSGSRFIRIQEEPSTEDNSNLLALKSRVDRRYFLNAKTRRIAEKETPYQTIHAGTKWTYDSQRGVETITARGPTNSDVILMILVQRRNVKVLVRFSYILHVNDVPRPRDTYRFELRRMTPCSVTCGVGIRRAKYGCRSVNKRKWVNKKKCRGKAARSRKPGPATQRCVMECRMPARWVSEDWGPCSKSCGARGLQQRTVACHQVNSEGQNKVVADRLCLGEERPTDHRACKPTLCPPKWRVGKWSQCSVSCGTGIQRRQVICRPTAKSKISAETECADPRPADVQDCNVQNCGQSETVTTATMISAATTTKKETCVKDQSLFCIADSMAHYCNLPNYRKFCCKTCKKYFLENDETGAQLGPVTIEAHSIVNETPEQQQNINLSNYGKDFKTNSREIDELSKTNVSANSLVDLPLKLVPSAISDVVESDVNGNLTDEQTMKEVENMDTMNEDSVDNDGYYDDSTTDEYLDGVEVEEVIETIPPRNNTNIMIPTAPPNINKMMSQKRNSTDILKPSEANVSTRRRRSARNEIISVHTGWSGCKVKGCGTGIRYSINGCWNISTQTWADVSSCSHTNTPTFVCFVPCYFLPKSLVRSSDNDLYLRPSSECRERRGLHLGPRVNSYRCRSSARRKIYFWTSNHSKPHWKRTSSETKQAGARNDANGS